MNVLIVGTNKSDILKHLPETFLLIDDGPFIDAFPRPKTKRQINQSPKIVEFDLTVHSYDPLKGITYERACELISIFDALFPEGENTLTRKGSNFELLKALTNHSTDLRRLITPIKDNPGSLDAHQKIQRIFLSPKLRRFLTSPTKRFSFDGIILARLDRTILSDFDCRLIANLLIWNYQGHVVVPDYGFYACGFHERLIRQHRLIAGINHFPEAPMLKHNLPLMDIKIAKHCTAGDAETLADFSGHARESHGYVCFVQQAVS